MSQEEVELAGGNLSRVVRVGDTVRRATGPWTVAVHALLRHLEAKRFRSAPRVLGFDERGREILAFLPGDTVGDHQPWPAWSHGEATLSGVGGLLRDYHAAVSDFVQPEGTSWRLTDARAAPGEIICHNDVAPYNLVHGTAGLGLIDWDLASPGTPDFDLAFAAWQTVPFFTDEHAARLGWGLPVDRPGRLRVLLEAYGHDHRTGFVGRLTERIQASHDRIRQEAERGDEAFVRMVEAGHLNPIVAALRMVERESAALQAEIER